MSNEIKKIKITMLGATSAGKTCYMLAMYAKMTEGIDGFTLNTTDMDEDIRLIDMWAKVESETGQNRWPPPNNEEPQLYEFDFNHGFKNLMTFDWLDYRGGALRDSSSKEDKKTLQQRLGESSCIFLCISGEYLREKANPGVTRKANIDRMNLFMQNIAKDGKRVPIVILITKFDLCKGRPKNELLGDIRQLFNPFFAENAEWIVMVCPVTLGDELANDIGGGLIAPQHVHIPLIFAIYSDFAQNARIKYEEFKKKEEKLQSVKSRGIPERIIDLWKGRNPEEDIMSHMQYLTRELNESAEKLILLSKKLIHPDILIFHNGAEIEIDV